MSRVRKAVFPVAGFGTRFLPATKATPKEMLPIVDKPLIQYAVEEALAAGITEIIFITNTDKHAIEDHFDSNVVLEQTLAQREQWDRLAMVRDIVPEGVTCAYVRQTQPLGLGHAIACARALIGDEPFAVLLADDFILNDGPGCLQQMVDTFAETQHSILAVQPVPRDQVHKYGVIAPKSASTGPVHELSGIVEKPPAEQAPSELAVVGRYILTPEIFNYLKNLDKGIGGEIQLTDGIAKLLEQQAVSAYQFTGHRYDCGSKIGYLQATFAVAKEHPEVKDAFKTLFE